MRSVVKRHNTLQSAITLSAAPLCNLSSHYDSNLLCKNRLESVSVKVLRHSALWPLRDQRTRYLFTLLYHHRHYFALKVWLGWKCLIKVGDVVSVRALLFPSALTVSSLADDHPCDRALCNGEAGGQSHTSLFKGTPPGVPPSCRPSGYHTD